VAATCASPERGRSSGIALIAGTPVGKQLTVYSGLNSLIPIGERERGIFTPP
jgi:hypothetical protein